jgi:hypothetical protein
VAFHRGLSENLYTIYIFRGTFNDLLIVGAMCPRSVPHSSQSTDNILCNSTVLRQLSTKLLDHAVDVIEFGLVARRRRNRHSRSHVGPIHAVHHGNLLLLPLVLRLRGVLIWDLLLLLLLLVLLLLLLLVVTRC